MVLDKLSDSLKNTLKKITSALFVDEKLINELVKDIQRSLLQADVNVNLVLDITKKIKERALKEESPRSMSKKEFLIKIVYEELVEFLGGPGPKIEITKKPFRLMLVGLFGSGKTTTIGKIGHFFQKRGLKVAVVQTDTWRPAAYEQLKQAADKAELAFFGNKKEKDPVNIYKEYEKELEKYDLILIDTAGRDALNDELIDEIKKINTAVKADETLLVISADLGQAAQKQAQAFHDACNVTGVMITKLDGTAKGGGALIACSVTGAKVKFIGTGEKINDIEEFKPEGFVGRMLGMGDLEALLEKAKESFTEEQAEDMGKKLLKGEFNLIDLYEQMQSMKKMGPLSKVMEMIPGFGGMKIPKEMLDNQQVKLENWKYIMSSMTKEELEDPEKVMNSSRISRIAQGSGIPAEEIRALLKQYKQSKKMIKMMKGDGKNMDKILKKLQKGGLPGGMKFG